MEKSFTVSFQCILMSTVKLLLSTSNVKLYQWKCIMQMRKKKIDSRQFIHCRQKDSKSCHCSYKVCDSATFFAVTHPQREQVWINQELSPCCHSRPSAGRRLLRRRQVGSAASRVPPHHSGLLCVPPHCSICIVWVNSFVCICPWRDQGRVGNKTNFPPPAAPHCLHLIGHVWMDITDNNAPYWPQ